MNLKCEFSPMVAIAKTVCLARIVPGCRPRSLFLWYDGEHLEFLVTPVPTVPSRTVSEV